MGWRFEINQVTVNGWGWKLRAPNDTLIARGDKLYASVEDTEKAIKKLQPVFAKVSKIVDMDSPTEVAKRTAGMPVRKSTQTPKREKPDQPK